MLNLLAWIVGASSLGLYLLGFFVPEVHRKSDLIWSGVGLLYALVLVTNEERSVGGVLLGQIASVVLIVAFGWQTLQQRRQLTDLKNQTAIPNSLKTLTPFLTKGWSRISVTYRETLSWMQSQGDKDNPNAALDAAPTQPHLKDSADDEWELSPSIDSEPHTTAVSTASVNTDGAIELIAEPDALSKTQEIPSPVTTEPPAVVEAAAPTGNWGTETPHHSSETAKEATDTLGGETTLPVVNVAESTEPPITSTHSEEDESWPPPDPVT